MKTTDKPQHPFPKTWVSQADWRFMFALPKQTIVYEKKKQTFEPVDYYFNPNGLDDPSYPILWVMADEWEAAPWSDWIEGLQELIDAWREGWEAELRLVAAAKIAPMLERKR